MFLLTLLFGMAISQNINLVQTTILSPAKMMSMDLYQNHLFTASVSMKEILQFDLNGDKYIQNCTLPVDTVIYNAFRANSQYLIIGLDILQSGFTLIPSNNLQSNFRTYYTLGTVNCIEFIKNDQVLIGTSYGFEKWDLSFVRRIQSISSSEIYQLQAFNDSSLFILTPSYIEERSLNDLTVIYKTYYPGYLNGPPNSMMQKDENIFIGYYNGKIQQLNWNTQQIVRTFTNHSGVIISIQVSDSFLFSGSFDYYWIQWQIETSQVIRKVNTDGQVYKLLIYDSYLLTAGNGGLRKYQIPELLNVVSDNSSNFQDNESISTTINFFNLKTESNSLVSVESAKPKTTKKQVSQSNNNTTYDFTGIYLIIGTICFCVIFVIGFAYFIYKNRNQNAKEQKQKDNEKPSETDISSLKVAKTTSTSVSTTNFTLVCTENAYSIPGYLQMKSEDINVIQQITKGGQGTISIAEFSNTDFFREYNTKQVIVKSTGKNFEQMSERKQRAFYQELAIIHYFKNKPGFVRLYGYTLEPANLILRFYQYGSMDNLISKRGSLQSFQVSKNFIICFILEISRAILLLHAAGFVHCDIKSQNILLDIDQNGKIHPVLTDFGLSQVVNDKVLQVRAMSVEKWKGFSLNYAAPEQIYEALARLSSLPKPEIIYKRDIYAISGLIYALILKKEPWHNLLRPGN